MKKKPLALVLALAALPTLALAQPPKLEVQEVADTGSMPKGASLSPDGKHFYVTNFGQLNKRNITIYDAETLKAEGEIDVPGVVVESVLSPDGKRLYVSNFRRSSVMFIDVASKSVTHEIRTGTHPKVLVVSPDGKSLFAANWATNDVTQIDTAKGEVVRTLAVGKQPRGMAVSKKGTLYVANFFGDSIDVFTGPDYADRKRIPVCKVPRHLALSPDEKTLYMSCLNYSQLHAMDTSTFQVTHRVPIGNAPKSIDVSHDGRYVYSADFGHTHSVTVVDTHEWTSRVFTIPGMDRGSGVVVSKDGRHALVTGWFDNHIYLVGFEGSGGHPEESAKRIRSWQYRPKHEGTEGTGG
jgi:YVTN family beta-propeller protein